MSEEIQAEEMDMELDFNKLEQVSGGMGRLEQLVTRIVADGHADELKTLLKTRGKQLQPRNAVNTIRSSVDLRRSRHDAEIGRESCLDGRSGPYIESVKTRWQGENSTLPRMAICAYIKTDGQAALYSDRILLHPLQRRYAGTYLQRRLSHLAIVSIDNTEAMTAGVHDSHGCTGNLSIISEKSNWVIPFAFLAMRMRAPIEK